MRGFYPWYVLGVLTLAQTCHSIDRAIIGLVLEPVGREFNLTDGQLGLLAGFAYGIFFALAALPFGVAVDKHNRRTLMTAALAGWSMATALCGLATNFLTLLLGRAAVGLAEAGGSPTGVSLLSDYFRQDRRATAIGVWYVSGGLGLSAAFFLGGWIVEQHGWRAAFLAAGAPGLILAPILFLTVREPARSGAEISAIGPNVAAGLLGRIAALAARPGLLACIASVVCITIGLTGMGSWVAVFLMRVHATPISQAGLIVALCYGLVSAVGVMAAGWATDRVNRRSGGFQLSRTALLGGLGPVLAGVFGIAAVTAPDLALCVAALMGSAFFSAAFNGPIYAVLAELAGPRQRGLAVSLLQFSANLVGLGLGPLLVGVISQRVGADGLAWGLGVVMAFPMLGGLFLLLAARQMKALSAGV